MSFRVDTYASLLRNLRAAGRQTIGVADFIRARAENQGVSYAILRHDVDRLPSWAVALARVEQRECVAATYYFRCNAAGKFPDAAVRAISAAGHEVGYHYECLSACGGDREAALAMFARNLAAFRELASCRSVAMHGAPLSRHRNQDLLLGFDLAAFDLEADASLSFEQTVLAYFTDTGGRWNADRVTNFRDRVGRSEGGYPDPFDPDFAAWLRRFPDPVYIATHPERWAQTSAGFAHAAIRDSATNAVKQLIRMTRAGKP
jgi:hypothetical protein